MTPVLDPKYIVVNVRTLRTVVVALDEAARIAELDPDDIEWAIEQVGRCDTDEWTMNPSNANHNPHGRS